MSVISVSKPVSRNLNFDLKAWVNVIAAVDIGEKERCSITMSDFFVVIFEISNHNNYIKNKI